MILKYFSKFLICKLCTQSKYNIHVIVARQNLSRHDFAPPVFLEWRIRSKTSIGEPSFELFYYYNKSIVRSVWLYRIIQGRIRRRFEKAVCHTKGVRSPQARCTFPMEHSCVHCLPCASTSASPELIRDHS